MHIYAFHCITDATCMSKSKWAVLRKSSWRYIWVFQDSKYIWVWEYKGMCTQMHLRDVGHVIKETH